MQPSVPPNSFAVRVNVFTLKFARRWLQVALTIIGIYASLPVITPLLMELGLTGPGRVLYTLYSPFCHQFGFRSLYLFGDQPAYPRAVTGTSQAAYEDYVVDDPAFLESYRYWYSEFNGGAPAPESVTRDDLTNGFTPWFQFAARDFVGNDQMGYKMTLCARDVAIYGALFLGGLIYSRPFVRRRIRPVPLLLYAFLGLGPIGIDGFSQLLSYPPFNLWETRETLPFFRVLTGFLFGFMNAWLAFPYLEQSFAETRERLEFKLARAGILVR